MGWWCFLFLGFGTGEAGKWPYPLFETAPEVVLRAAQSRGLHEEGDHVRVFYYEQAYSIDESERVTWHSRMVYLIGDTEGLEWAQTSAFWQPWYQARPVIKVRIIRPDGSQVALQDEHVVERPAEQSGDLYSDARTLEAPFSGVVVGSVIEEEITTTETQPFFEGGAAERVYLPDTYKVDHLRLALDLPKKSHLVYRLYNLPELEPIKAEAHGRISYRFDWLDFESTYDWEIGQPLDFSLGPTLSFSTVRSWQALATAYSRLVDQQLQDPADAMPDPGIIVPGDARASANNLCHWINERVRYTGLELGMAAIVPVSPREALERGFGDCKDKATLLVNYLRRAGFEANVALLLAGRYTDVDPDLPSLKGFNHVIVHVGGKQPFFIDPTVEYNREGFLPTGDRNRWTLVANPKMKGLLKTPAPNTEENRVVEDRVFTFSEETYAHVDETTHAYGALETQLRSFFQAGVNEESTKNMEDYLNRAYRFGKLKGFEMNISQPREPLELKLSIDGSGRGVRDKQEAAIGVMNNTPLLNLDSIFLSEEPITDRHKPYVIELPYTYEVHYRLFPPKGYLPRNPPSSEELTLGTMTFSRKERLEEGVFLVDLRFDTGKTVLSPEELETTRAALAAFQNGYKLMYYDHQGARLMAEGRYQEALEVYRADVAAGGDEIGSRLRYSEALLQAGMGEVARATAREATILDPTSAAAFTQLGRVLQHDLFGRFLKYGYDRKGAIAAYEQALTLDPKNRETMMALAGLCEYDLWGTRYAEGSDLNRAIELYRALGEGGEGGELDTGQNLQVALYRARRFEELEREAPKLTDEVQRHAMTATAIIANRGQAAGNDYFATLPDRDMRLSCKAAVASLLMEIGFYKAAAQNFRDVAHGGVNAAQLEALADTLNKITPQAQFPVLPDNPENVTRRFIATTIQTHSADLSNLAPLLSEEMFQRALLSEKQNNLFRMQKALRNASEQSGLGLTTLMDMGLSHLILQKAGDAKTGYRVWGEIQGKKIILYLKHAAKGLVIFADNENTQFLGAQVLDHLAAGDLEAAGRFLDWAAEGLWSSPTEPLIAHDLEGFWEPGAAREPGAIKLAAAALLASGPNPDPGIAILEGEPGQDEEQPFHMDRTLLAAYYTGKHYRKAFQIAKRFRHSQTKSTYLRFLMFDCAQKMIRLGMEGGSEALAEAETFFEDRDPSLETNYLELAEAERKEGFSAMVEAMEKLERQGRTDPNLFNEIAWAALFHPPLHPRALEWSRRAVTAEEGNYSYTQTLALLYADSGRCKEALELLHKCLELSPQVNPATYDWVVLGRIAEQYDLKEAAIAYYERVEKPAREVRLDNSSWSYANGRLVGLKANP